MGYSITIGQATPYFNSEYFPEFEACWRVEDIERDDAPVFPNDPAENGNSRYPSYLAWSNFCTTAKIYDLFYHKETGLFREHSGCFGITVEHLKIIQDALAAYRKVAVLPPGFWGPDSDDVGKYDGTLACLIWLEYWMRWAIENCSLPAIYNS